MIKILPKLSVFLRREKISGNVVEVMRAQIICDSADELTGLSFVGNVKCDFGSLAYAIDDGKIYGMDSTGAWNEMAAGGGGLPADIKYGSSFAATIDPLTYVMTMTLKDQNGDTLGTAQTVDLPLETMVVGAAFDAQTQSIILTLQSGQTVSFSVAALVAGLLEDKTSYTHFGNGLRLYVSSTEPTGNDIPEGSVWIGGAVSS